MSAEIVRDFPGACTYWHFVASRPTWITRVRRQISQWRRQPAPESLAIKAPPGPGRWVLYFIYLPDGRLTQAHRYTLARLAQEDLQVMVVCACAPRHPVLNELMPWCQALHWKELKGWDFCAYAIGLAQLAKHAPGSDVLVMNDSVYGPFFPLVPFINQAPWRLTGFTGNNQAENHIQSYAFIIKCIDDAFVTHLSGIIDLRLRYCRQEAVVLCQETRLARKAAEKYTVGSYWFTTSNEANDLCLGWPVQLTDAGFPFMKRSLLGKFVGVFNRASDMQALLQRFEHPVDVGAHTARK